MNCTYSSFKGLHFILQGRDFASLNNSVSPKDNNLRGISSVYPETQTKFRKCVGFIKVNLMGTHKEETISERSSIMCQGQISRII